MDTRFDVPPLTSSNLQGKCALKDGFGSFLHPYKLEK
jgi:hypothetical protein